MASVEKKLDIIRQYTDLPVGVGFGISDAESARSVSKCADAVVVGSAIVKSMAANTEQSVIIDEISKLLKSIRKAMDE